MKMKTLNLAVILSTAIFLTSGLAQAKDKSDINHQNLSKRPYQEIPEDAANKSADDWEGATLEKRESKAQAGPTEYQKLRINMLGKQPYLEGKAE
jgi:hypothetical protein